MAALAVVALVMAMGFRAIGESAARVRAANAEVRALMIARTRLDSVGADIPLADGDTEGRDGDFDWRVTVTPEPSVASAAGALWRARVVVFQGRVRRAGLDSLRLGPET